MLKKIKFGILTRVLYKTLKGKIKHVFINIYAKSQGCYNGCIGEQGTENLTLTSLISNYDNQIITNINDYISQNNPSNTAVPVFCSIPESQYYQQKQKRFVPIDFAYNANLSQQKL